MAEITLYECIDETGDPKKDDRIFICGYVGWEEAISQFVTRWDSAKGPNVSPIHATELLSHSRDFLGWTVEQVDALVKRLIDAIRTTMPLGIAVGFDMKHYRTLTIGQQNEIGRPLLTCVARVIDLAVKYIGEMRSRGDQIDGVNLNFDDSEKESVEMLSTWIKLKRDRRDLIDYIASIGFADDKRFYPLQAADLLANLTNRYWQPVGSRTVLSADRMEHHLRTLLTPDPSFEFAYRIDFVTAEDMKAAVRLHKRLY